MNATDRALFFSLSRHCFTISHQYQISSRASFFLRLIKSQFPFFIFPRSFADQSHFIRQCGAMRRPPLLDFRWRFSFPLKGQSPLSFSTWRASGGVVMRCWGAHSLGEVRFWWMSFIWLISNPFSRFFSLSPLVSSLFLPPPEIPFFSCLAGRRCHNGFLFTRCWRWFFNFSLLSCWCEICIARSFRIDDNPFVDQFFVSARARAYLPFLLPHSHPKQIVFRLTTRFQRSFTYTHTQGNWTVTNVWTWQFSLEDFQMRLNSFIKLLVSFCIVGVQYSEGNYFSHQLW